jgi:murein DD-endopeptidase MepM/ murein hydrolase activator NlpD
MQIQKRYRILIGFVVIVLIGLILPQHYQMPVEGATKSDYDQDSFWFYPWGKSVTHKGVDIFANAGTPVHPATNGMVVYTGQIAMGGNVVLVLGPKWRLHYYAHLKEIKAHRFVFVNKNSIIGLVGATGNAAGKSPHLHYSIVSLLPYLWKIDNSILGWKKMFYLNPITYLNETFNS